MNDAEYLAKLENLKVAFTSEAWEHIVEEMESALQNADTVLDIDSASTLWFRKGQLDAFQRVLALPSMVDQQIQGLKDNASV